MDIEIAEVIHIIAIISWMAGLLYLPRIFVYHTQVEVGSDSDKIFQVMEKKLLRYIMNPAMIVVFITGPYLAIETGFIESPWMHAKITLVVIVAIFHHMLAKWRKDFANGKNTRSEKFYRIANEVPTICLIGIVTLVVFKPW